MKTNAQAPFALGAPKFMLGKLIVSANMFASIPLDQIFISLFRHMNGDWGDISLESWKSNEKAMIENSSIISAFCSSQGVKFYIKTELKRKFTIVSLQNF
jgi:hypothetical protein